MKLIGVNFSQLILIKAIIGLVMKKGKMKNFGNITGAFADGAVLFPILSALAIQAGMNGNVLLLSSGLAYLAAGIIFRVPMSVQPLKSVAVTALAVGASATEIGISGALVGLICLLLSVCYADKLADLVPRHIVQGLQVALGIMLMTKGAGWGITDDIFSSSGFVLLTALILVFSILWKLPVLGWVAFGGVFLSLLIWYSADAASESVASQLEKIRPEIILALVLPQIALTLTNSVVGTQDVCRRYFPDSSEKVTPTRLLRTIGIGNLIFAPFGGLPFCHGSGGVTAHVKGGAKSWRMNMVIGGALILLSAFSWMASASMIPSYPKILMASLLFVTGWFHIALGAPSWKNQNFRGIMIVMALTALVSQNMLWTLVVGAICEIIRVQGIRYLARRENRQ